MWSPEKSRHSIEALLAAGVQPMPDLAPEEFEALRKGLGKQTLGDPVNVSSDGILLDGHQRARALLANGRKYLTSSEIHIVADATRDNAYEYAVQFNVSRRHLNVEQKADLARRLQRERRWSQAKIAKLFGVSRPAVSQWLAKHPDDETVPVIVEGLDGKTYVNVYDPPPPQPPRPEQRNMWRPDGPGFLAVKKALALLEREPLAGINPLHAARLRDLLADTLAACEGLLTQLATEHPTAATG